MLPVIAPPTTAVVAATSSTVLSSKSSVVSVATLLLMAPRVLVTKTAKTAILIVTAKVTWITTKALLLRVLRTLSTLSRCVLRGRSRAARLRTKSRCTRSAILGFAERLQRLFCEALLTALLLSVGTLMTIGLRTAEGVRKAAETTSSSCRDWSLRGAGCRAAVFVESSGRTAGAVVYG